MNKDKIIVVGIAMIMVLSIAFLVVSTAEAQPSGDIPIDIPDNVLDRIPSFGFNLSHFQFSDGVCIIEENWCYVTVFREEAPHQHYINFNYSVAPGLLLLNRNEAFIEWIIEITAPSTPQDKPVETDANLPGGNIILG